MDTFSLPTTLQGGDPVLVVNALIKDFVFGA